MENDKSGKFRGLTYVLGAIALSGVVAEALVLYAVDDPAMRLRLGLVCVAWVAFPLAIAGWDPVRAAARYPVKPHNRRFFLLRRRVEEFLREVTRLNWLVLDAHRDPRTAEARREEIETVESDLHELLGEIFKAAGRPGAQPESDEPFKARFSQAFPAIRDFAPRLEIELEPEQHEPDAGLEEHEEAEEATT